MAILQKALCILLAMPKATAVFAKTEVIRKVVRADGAGPAGGSASRREIRHAHAEKRVDNFAHVYKAVCNGMFDAEPVNGEYPPTLSRRDSSWAERAFAEWLPHDGTSKLRTDSSGVQGDLFKLAQKIYFGKVASHRPAIWGSSRKNFGMVGGAWSNQRDIATNKSSWYYIGVGKNAITSFHQFLEPRGWDSVKLEHIHQAHQPNLFYVAREPLGRFVSAYTEISVMYKKALPPQVQDVEAKDHFLKVFEMFVGQDGKCNDDSTVWCNKKKWGWVHLAPQTWFLDWWFPGNYSFNVSFDLTRSSSAFPQLWTAMGHQDKSDVKKENVKAELVIKKHALASMKNTTVQRAACAFYARDYLCLGYDLPKACQADMKSLASTLFTTDFL